MTPHNIDRFNRFCLAVLQELYESFPVPVDMAVNSTMLSVVPEEAGREETWNSMASAEHAMKFLATEGFIKYMAAYLEGDKFIQVTLTMKGLNAMGNVPSSLQKQVEVASKVKGVLAKGIKEASSKQVSDLIGKIFNYGIAAAPGIIAKIIT